LSNTAIGLSGSKREGLPGKHALSTKGTIERFARLSLQAESISSCVDKPRSDHHQF
jgi:hypothetical protein